VSHAHAVIENDSDLDELRRKVGALWQDRLVSKGLAGRNNG